MRRKIIWILAAAMLFLSACGASGVKVEEQKGAAVKDVNYADCVVSGNVTFDADQTKVRYTVSAKHEKDGSIQGEEDAFQDVKAGEARDFSYDLKELPYTGTLHYGGSKGLGELSQEILTEGEVYLTFVDADGNTLAKLKLR